MNRCRMGGLGGHGNSKFKISNFFNSKFAPVIHVRKTNDTIPDGFLMNSDYFLDVDLFWKMVVKIHVSFMDSLMGGGHGNSKFKISNFFNSKFAPVIHVRKSNDTIPDGFHMNSNYFLDVGLFWKMVVKIHVSS